ncbi:hypothetical protein [Actinomyces gerencseriae]|uniref:hypothetical protein n=1 Tax=Actinomyces gerencseriae TaxID=52769 RepID=UPI0023F0C9CC|nr:hypothetical protein [Actinomyces gerencseriae]
MEEPGCGIENCGFTPPEAGFDEELPEPGGVHVPMSGLELDINDGGTDDEDGTLPATCPSTVVIFVSAVDKLLDVAGIRNCRRDNAD